MSLCLTGGSVITGDGSVFEEGAVLIEGDEIVAVEDSAAAISDGADRVIRCPDHTLMPGLIDAHVHIANDAGIDLRGYTMTRSIPERVIDTITHARETLAAGITTVRDVGSPTAVTAAVREAIAAGRVSGARILTSGHGITSTGGHGDDQIPWHLREDIVDGRMGVIADGESGVRQAVREQLDAGADLIKIWATCGIIDRDRDELTLEFSQSELDSIVAEATRQNVPVAAHAHSPAGIQAVVEAGVSTVEHGTYMDESTIERMADAGVSLVPTLSTMRKISQSDELPAAYRDRTQRAMEYQATTLTEAHEAGIPLAMGTDAGAPTYAHGENALEIECMVDAGIDPRTALEIATRGSAEAIGIGDTVGVLEPGYRADVIAVQGEPLQDVTVLQDSDAIELVVADGAIEKSNLGNDG